MSTSPRRLGKYELQERLGRGGMAEVWKAHDTQLRRYVAIKLLHADLQADPSFITRFEREAQVIASLHHPNIVQIHDFHISRPPEVESTIAYMVMDYVEGQTLAEYIRTTSRVGKIPAPTDIVHLFTPIASAIDYAHQKGMVHRDIKPANILLDKRNITRNPMGEPILSDFGIAKLLGATTGTLSGWWLGTPLYISPEQAMGSPGNERSDIYSLGIILYEICTGVLPFQGETPAAIMMQHINTMPTSPALINPNIPPALTMVILRSISKDPAARFPAASSLVAALAESLNLPVPETLNIPAYPVDAMYSPTYLSPARPNIPPGMTPSGPSLPIMGASSASQPVALSTPPSAIQQSATPPGRGPANSTPVIGGFSGGSAMGQSAPNMPAVTSLQQPQTLSSSSTVLHPSPQTPAPPSSPPAPGKRRRGLLIALIALLIIALAGSGLGAFLLFTSKAPPVTVASNSVLGHVFFLSSGKVKETDNRGINDQLVIDLHNLKDPDPGKSYYAWLVSDTTVTELVTVPIGKLTLNHGSIYVFYPGDAEHTNLIAHYSRFLITQEDTNAPPLTPSLNQSAWSYYAELPQKVNPADNLSMLSHLRHLLSADPTLDKLNLPGGLNIWLFRNTQKVLEWAGSARDDWTTKTPQNTHKHLIRILEYLDSLQYVQLDVPDRPFVNYVNNTIAQVPLLAFPDAVNQKPPDYLHHIDKHMHAVVQAPGVTPQQSQLATEIDKAINNVGKWLSQVRADAKQLVVMDDQQLLQPSSLDILNDMVTQATYAFIGQPNPVTNRVDPGVSQIYYDIQRLATFDVTVYKA